MNVIVKINGQPIAAPVTEVSVVMPAAQASLLQKYMKKKVKPRAERIASFIEANSKKHALEILVPTALMLTEISAQPQAVYAQASLGDNTAFKGDGHYLLDIVVIAFFSMVIVTICKLAGRGEIAGVVLFLSGCVVLIDVIKVFRDLYDSIAAFIT